MTGEHPAASEDAPGRGDAIHRLLLALVLAAACAVRLRGLAVPGVLVDEAATLWVANAPTVTRSVIRGAWYQLEPPLYFLGVRALSAFADPLLAARCLSAAASCAAVAAAALLGLRAAGRRAALLAALLVALDPRWIGFGFFARPYALALLFMLLGWDRWLALVRAPSPSLAWQTTLAAAAAAWTSVFALPAVGSQALLGLALLGRRTPAERRGLLAPAVTGLLLVLPAASVTLVAFSRRSDLEWHRELVGPDAALRWAPLGYVALAWCAFGLASALGPWGWIRPRSPKRETVALAAGGILLPGLFLYCAATFGSKTLAHERYWCSLAVPSVVLVAWLLDPAGKPARLVTAVSVFVLLLFGGLPLAVCLRHYGHPIALRADWRLPVAEVDRLAPDGALVLVRSALIESDSPAFLDGDAEALSYIAAPLVLSHRAARYEIVSLPLHWHESHERRYRVRLASARDAGRPVVLVSAGPPDFWDRERFVAWLRSLGFEPDAARDFALDGFPIAFEVRRFVPPPAGAAPATPAQPSRSR